MGFFLDLGDYNRCAAVAWAGSSGSAAEAASPGAKPHRARQGYAAGMRDLGFQCWGKSRKKEVKCR